MDHQAKIRLALILFGVVGEIFLAIIGLSLWKDGLDHFVPPSDCPKGKLLVARAGYHAWYWEDTPENRRRICRYSKRIWGGFLLLWGAFFFGMALFCDRLF